jgi:hypothetical protein
MTGHSVKALPRYDRGYMLQLRASVKLCRRFQTRLDQRDLKWISLQ